MTCILIVKSDTTLVDKKEFENWYAKEHLSEAKGAFMAKNAKRGWIKNTNFRLAIYEFENNEDAEKAINLKNLEIHIKKFGLNGITKLKEQGN
tara:strand:+ start:72 stop:350 length:279 start_codon:yes stop_codon:yes gene_type:complete